MRTTVDLPDDLFRAVKAEAAARGETLKDFVTRAVTQELGTAVPARQHGRRMRLPLIESKQPGTLNLTNEDIEEIFAEEEAEHYHRKYLRGAS
ncbi:MAG TPA: hypothetical protein VHJ83_07425 [Micromonosporaceae bacterium]|jgi:hypothetical protein|nr:hypothetical protein [Micromonosporaceae bacterium]